MQGIVIPTPSQQVANQAVNQSAAVAQNGGQIGTLATGNDFQNGTEVQITITRSGGGTLGVVWILNGAGKTGTFAASNTSGTTFNSPDWDTADNFRDYASRVGLLVNGLRFDTDNVANYSNIITLGERMPNSTLKYKKLQLNKYRVATGNTYANTATVNDGMQLFTIHPAFYLSMSDLALGSSFTIYANVIGMDKTIEASAVEY